jgi:hypothetical protein
LDIEVHLVKEGQIISKVARSQAKLIHGMQLVLARNYIENLRVEVMKGTREKAEQGTTQVGRHSGTQTTKLIVPLMSIPRMPLSLNACLSFMRPGNIRYWNCGQLYEGNSARLS